jgi:hypothetical protein
MKLCFVSVNGHREPYLLDEPRICSKNAVFIKSFQLISDVEVAWAGHNDVHP